MKNFDVDNDTSDANHRLQEEEQFHSNNYLSEIPRSHSKMCSKSAPQKLNFVIRKLY